jgi:hypothetical protein
MFFSFILRSFGDVGIAPDIRQDDQQLEFHGRLDHHDDQNSIKQSLVSSYKKNLYPSLKAEIHRNVSDPVLSTTRNILPSSRSK